VEFTGWLLCASATLGTVISRDKYVLLIETFGGDLDGFV